jgi:hypothetical protein
VPKGYPASGEAHRWEESLRKVSFALAVAATLTGGYSKANEALTVGQCLLVLQGLEALDRYEDPANPGKFKQYKLGALRMTIGLDIGALVHVRDAFNRARNGIIAERAAPGVDLRALTPEAARLNLEIDKLTDLPCDTTIPHIKAADLKPGDGENENQYPPSVLGAIAPIIDR